jgi:hypothetical protein
LHGAQRPAGKSQRGPFGSAAQSSSLAQAPASAGGIMAGGIMAGGFGFLGGFPALADRRSMAPVSSVVQPEATTHVAKNTSAAALGFVTLPS